MEVMAQGADAMSDRFPIFELFLKAARVKMFLGGLHE
jgi:hypothetical protein